MDRPQLRQLQEDTPLAANTRSFCCRFCSAPLRTTFVDLGMSPLCQTHIAPSSCSEMEPFYPLHAYVCDAVLPGAAAGVRLAARTSSPSTRTSPRTRRAGSSTRGATSRWLIERFGSDCEQQGHGDRQQRRLPAAALRRSAACRCWASSRPPMSPRPRSRRAFRRRCASSARSAADEIAARARPARPAARQQRAGPRAGPERLRRAA